jgi:hypothetical protein
MIESLVQVAMFWEENLPKAVSKRTGAFIRLNNACPEVQHLANMLAFERPMIVNDQTFCWRQQFEFPLNDWHPDRILAYAAHVMEVMDACHDRHCEYELYSASSNLTGE